MFYHRGKKKRKKERNYQSPKFLKSQIILDNELYSFYYEHLKYKNVNVVDKTSILSPKLSE